MDIVLTLVVAGALCGVAAGGVWVVARAFGVRYRHLLTAVELSQRQLTELRLQQDDLVRQVAVLTQRVEGLLENEVIYRLRDDVVPRLARLDRDLELRAAVESLERGAREGRVAKETAERMRGQLGSLAEANAAGERPY